MTRGAFVTLAAAAGAYPRFVRAGGDADPASQSATPSLRVLLGGGDAQPAPGGFLFNGRPYRGTFERLPDGTIVNVVDLEQYLYAVVPHEMPSSWPPGALQAQAVCARTYVLQRSDPRRNYDLVPSEADQVYAGVAAESPAGRAAVDATAGQVLRFGTGYASIAYSSCCGGHTESAADAWSGGALVPYLAGVACPYCTQSPNYRWSVSVALADVAQRFASQLGGAGTLRDVRVGDVDPSGRARTVQLIADRSVAVKGSAFRLTMGARVVRSLLLTNVRADDRSASVEIDGGGLGHGVGMCQWGARGMAQLGRASNDVLAFYFPGTAVGTY